jgi:hypothetical protein
MMIIGDYIKLIEKYFGFLITQYGFSIVYKDGPGSFGDCAVVLQSGDCRINIFMDRGGVIIEVGLRYAPNYYTSSEQWEPGSLSRWYSTQHVTAFLTQGLEQVNWEYPPIDWNLDSFTRVEQQMAELSTILKPYWNQIIELFQEENFKKKQKELDKFVEDLWNKK